MIFEELQQLPEHLDPNFEFQEKVEQWRSRYDSVSEKAVVGRNKSSTVRVCCRQRTLLPNEKVSIGSVISGKAASYTGFEYESITVRDKSVFVHRESTLHGQIIKEIKTNEYIADVVFGPEVVNISSHLTEELVEAALEGGSSSIMCYGATGTGKTFTQIQLMESVSENLFLACIPEGRKLFLSFGEMYKEKYFF